MSDPPSHAAEGASIRVLTLGTRRALIIDVPELPVPGAAALGEAETEILNAVLEGLSNREIAELRGRSVRTVANQLASIYRKLGVVSRGELLALAAGTLPSDE